MIKKLLWLLFLLPNLCFAEWMGTGTFINNTDVMTCAHVVVGHHQSVLINGRYYRARLIYRNSHTDVAILRTSYHNDDYLTLTSEYQTGDAVTMYGFPMPDRFGKTLHETRGSVVYNPIDPYSTLNLKIHSYPGYSGAPLINSCGEIVGMDESGMGKYESHAGWGVPSSRAMSIISGTAHYCRGVDYDYIKEHNLVVMVLSE